MESSIWCKGYGCKVDAVEVFNGNLEYIPRVGEYINIFDDWGSEEVLAVYYSIETNEIVIEISPDYSGEYKKELEKRKKLNENNN